MRLLVVKLLMQLIAKVNVCHFGNGKHSQNCPSSIQNCYSCGRCSVPLCCLWREDRRPLERQEAPTLLAKQKLCAKFDLATLPPTSAAARQNSFRVSNQIQQWRDVALDPFYWGWKLKYGRLYIPLPSFRELSPDTLLRLITCNYRSGC